MSNDAEQVKLPRDGSRPGPYDMECASGRYVNVLNPDPADICLEDVAHHLSRICRYTGAIRVEHYSVAEHACIVADRLYELGATATIRLAGLHHDDSEAYLGDVGRPLKGCLDDYGPLEERMTDAIEDALGLTPVRQSWIDEWIKPADMWALAGEAFHLMPSRGKRWISDGLYDARNHPDMFAIGMSPSSARWRYMNYHYQLARLVDIAS